MTQRLGQAAQIFVSSLKLQARVGVNPNEQEGAQPIILDIWVGLQQLSRAAASEQLGDTIDYVAVTRTVRQIVSRRHYPLVESLALAIAQALIAQPGATSVRVRLFKPGCLKSAAGAGIEVELQAEPALPQPSAALPREHEEVVIVGGGAAGLAAALWCWRLGHPALLVDPGPQLGGQLHLVYGPMEDLLALPPLTGRELASELGRQFVSHGGRWFPGRLLGVQASPSEMLCQLQLEGPHGGQSLCTRVLLLATGVRRRRLGVPGEEELLGRGILATAAGATPRLANQLVVVVGGGDSACENALKLARGGARVVLVHRGARLSARAQFRAPVERDPKITVRLQSEVRAFLGGDQLEAVELAEPGGSERLAAQAALVRVGWLANSEGLPQAWLDPGGYVRTSHTGLVVGEQRVFAAGDLLGSLAPSVAVAFGSGAVAARAAVLLLEQEG